MDNTAILTENGHTKVVFYTTKIVDFNDKEIVLDNGGWESISTKARMNRISEMFDLGFHVKVKNGNWVVEYKDVIIPFENNKAIIER